MTNLPMIVPRGPAAVASPTIGSRTFVVRPNTGASNIRPEAVPRDMPLAIPRSQLYFWTAGWQEGEREALGERARGESRFFSTGTDAVRWLLDPDD